MKRAKGKMKRIILLVVLSSVVVTSYAARPRYNSRSRRNDAVFQNVGGLVGGLIGAAQQQQAEQSRQAQVRAQQQAQWDAQQRAEQERQRQLAYLRQQQAQAEEERRRQLEYEKEQLNLERERAKVRKQLRAAEPEEDADDGVAGVPWKEWKKEIIIAIGLAVLAFPIKKMFS